MDQIDETNVAEETTTEETAPEENTEETTSEDETEETSTEESSDEAEDEGIDWKERALKAEKAIEKSKKKAKDTKKEVSSDEVTLSRLEVRGVMEPEDQEYVLRFAKAEGISPIEALADSIVKDRLAANKRERDSVNATPRSNNRTANAEDEVSMWVRKYKRSGELPDNNPSLTSKILDQLAKGA